MKTVVKTVYSGVDDKKRKIKVAEISVEQYQTLDEVLKFTKTSKDAEAEIILCVNRMKMTDAMNSARADAVRDVNPITQLKRKMKADPLALAKVQELMAQLGIQF